MADALGNSVDYRVLRRLVPRAPYEPSIGQAAKTGVILDVETAASAPQGDEVVELGMVKFDDLT